MSCIKYYLHSIYIMLATTSNLWWVEVYRSICGSTKSLWTKALNTCVFWHGKGFLELSSCLSASTTVNKPHDHQQLGGRKGYFQLTSLRSSSFVRWSHGRNTKRAGADAEATEWCRLLACSSWLVQPAFLEHSGPAAQEWNHPQCVGTSHTNH